MTTKPSKLDAVGATRDGADVLAAKSSSGVDGLWWKSLCGLLMLFVIYGAFFIAKGAVNFVGSGDVARIIFFHVPVAIQCQLWYFIAAFYAARVLMAPAGYPGRADIDAKSATAMELGFVASILATITGSIFASLEWNSYWNWDPREISIVGLLLVYASYLVLRGAVAADPVKRAQLSAVYAIVTVIPATFLILVVPRIPALLSLHPPNVVLDANGTSPSYKLVLWTSFAAFTLLFVWLFQLRYRVFRLTTQRQASIVQ
jgi:heme exporter protein C